METSGVEVAVSAEVIEGIEGLEAESLRHCPLSVHSPPAPGSHVQ